MPPPGSANVWLKSEFGIDLIVKNNNLMEFGDKNDTIYWPNKIASSDSIMKCSAPIQWNVTPCVLKYMVIQRVQFIKHNVTLPFTLDWI